MKDDTIYTGRAIRNGNNFTLKFDTEEGTRLWNQRKLNWVVVNKTPVEDEKENPDE